MFIPLRPDEDAIETAGKLEENVFQDLCKKCVQSFLVLGQDRKPIKKQDLNRLAFPSVHFKTCAAVIQFANKELHKVFGMRIYELDDKTRYLLVNSSPDCASLRMVPCATEDEELGVLHMALMAIFASQEEKVDEDALERLMSALEIEDFQAHIESLVKKLYLTLEKDQEKKLYSWGPRAYAEIEPEQFFNQYLELDSGSKAEDWSHIRKRIDKLKSETQRS